MVRLPATAGVMDQTPADPAEALAISDPLIDAAFRQSVELVYQERFEACMALLDDLSRQRPHHPAPDFIRAAAYQSWMNTYRTNRFTAAMDAHLDAAIEKGRSLLETGEDPWLHVFIGAAKGFRALNRFRRGQWMSALTNITGAVDNLQHALRTAPQIYDAYMGIGTYNYWRSARSKFISNIAFWMTDRREVGLEQMRFVVAHGVYSAHETSYNLAAALIDHNHPLEALSLLAENVRQKRSVGLIDLYYRGRALQASGRWAPALSDFKALSERLEAAPLTATGYRAECSYRMALSFYHLNRRRDAQEAVTAAITLADRRIPADEIDNSFETFGDILEGLNALRLRLEQPMMEESHRYSGQVSAAPLN